MNKLEDFISKAKNMSNKRKFVVGLLFLIIVGIFFLGSKEDSSHDELSSKSRIPVVLTPLRLMVFEDIIAVQGNMESKNFAMVSSRIPGTIEEIYVDEGETVIAGQTKLFQTDDLNLNKAVKIQNHELEVADFEKRKKAAELERV